MPRTFRLATFFRQPLWDGSSLAGRTILVHGEQGIGDEIMFASCLPEVVEQAGTGGRRLRAAAGSAVCPVVSQGGGAWRRPWREHLWTAPASPAIDVQAPIGDLPRHLRTFAGELSQAACVSCEPILPASQFWRDRLAQLGPGPKIGISWRAGCRPHDRLRRSAPLAHWRSLLSRAGAQFIRIGRRRLPGRSRSLPAGRRALHTASGHQPTRQPGRAGRNDQRARSGCIGGQYQRPPGRGPGGADLGTASPLSRLVLAPRSGGNALVLQRPGSAPGRRGGLAGAAGRVEAEFLNWLRANSDNQIDRGLKPSRSSMRAAAWGIGKRALLATPQTSDQRSRKHTAGYGADGIE